MNRSNARVMWRMLGLARPLAGWMVLAVACGVAGFCCATGIPVLASAAALAAAGKGTLAWGLPAAVAALALMAVARGVLHYIEQRCNHYIAFRLLAHIRDLVFGALRKLCPAKLAGADRGSLVSTVTSDVELLEVFYAHTVSPVCIAALMAVVMGLFLGYIHPQLAALALASYALVGVAVPVLISRGSGTDGRARSPQRGALGHAGAPARRRRPRASCHDGRHHGPLYAAAAPGRRPRLRGRRYGRGRGPRCGCDLQLVWPLRGARQPGVHVAGHARRGQPRAGHPRRGAAGGRGPRRRGDAPSVHGRRRRARGLLVRRRADSR